MNKRNGIIQTLLLSLSLLVTPVTTFASERADIAWQKIEDGAMLIDVRTPGEYKAKHLDNAINLPLDAIKSAFQNIDRDQNLVVYCRSGNRSGQAKAYLEKIGYTNVHNGGGLEEMLHSQHN